MFALLSKVPEFHVEGSREALAEHAHVVARLLELARAPRDAPADGAAADLSAVTGRYVQVTLSTGEAQLFAEQSGAGRELLLLHTAGSDARQYHHVLADPGLQRDWRMTAFDLPAHGRSTPPSGMLEGEWRLTTDRYVEAVVAAADALELERPVVLGCSMGGEICFELALRHPDRFAAAIAVQGADRVEGRQVAWAKHARVNEKLFVPEWIDGLMSPHAPPARRAEVRWAYSQSAHGVYWGDIEFYSHDWDRATAWGGSTPRAARCTSSPASTTTRARRSSRAPPRNESPARRSRSCASSGTSRWPSIPRRSSVTCDPSSTSCGRRDRRERAGRRLDTAAAVQH